MICIHHQNNLANMLGLHDIMRINPVQISNHIRQNGLGHVFDARVVECLVGDLIGSVLYEPNCEVAPLSALVAAKDMLAAYLEQNTITYFVGWEAKFVRQLYNAVYNRGRSKECVLGKRL